MIRSTIDFFLQNFNQVIKTTEYIFIQEFDEKFFL